MFERLKRFNNLWKLSKQPYPPVGTLDKEKIESLWDKIEAESPILNPVKINQPARFIARIKENPIKKITEEQA